MERARFKVAFTHGRYCEGFSVLVQVIAACNAHCIWHDASPRRDVELCSGEQHHIEGRKEFVLERPRPSDHEHDDREEGEGGDPVEPSSVGEIQF
jgi:hypothetical protein